MTLVLKRTPEQQAALDGLLKDLQDPSHSDYHKWLTPEEFGERFGASLVDLQRLSDWLRAEGFVVESPARGRGWITFAGTVQQVQQAFQTELHRYQVGTRTHFAATLAPAVPAELGHLVAAIRGLDDFYLEPPSRPEPLFTATDGSHALAPGDIANIYGFRYYSTSTGKGETIAVAGESAIDLADIRLFRSTFQLPANDPQLLLVGNDPGMSNVDALREADADVEWAGGVARDAAILYAYAADAMVASQQVIDQNLASILTFSFGNCEANLSLSDTNAIRALAQQANAQGITWIASSGDAGPAACDQGGKTASHGLAVSFPASLPEVTAVGGTEFNEPNGASWGNNGTDGSSAYGYIPEVAWNDTSSTLGLAASGGGPSALYSKPSWQTGPGVPNDGARDIPDLALSASPAHDPYIVFSGKKTYAFGGTSISAPVFAGMLAISAPLGTSSGIPSSLGNLNPSLYDQAAKDAAQGLTSPNGMFNDVVSGTNAVPCQVATQDCSNGIMGYSAGPGYDLVTGLGSVNAAHIDLRLATSVTISAPSGSLVEGTPATFTVTVRAFDGGVPTGSVQIRDGTGLYAQSIGGANLDSTGTAVVSAYALLGGEHSLVATYGGNSLLRSSASAPLAVFVVPLPPQTPSPLAPANNATGVSVSTPLNWNVAGSVLAITYDVYFGTTSPPPYWGSLTDVRCWPSGLASNTTYYWKIVARNVSGTASSPISSFRTSGQPVYTISRIAGGASTAFSGDGGPAAAALLAGATDVAFDGAGNLYVADSGNHRIRMIDQSGVISTVAGSGAGNYSGDGGPALKAGLGVSIDGIVVDAQNNLYISVDSRIRKVSGGMISTITGDGQDYGDGGLAVNAHLGQPAGMAVDSAGNLYIADSVYNCVREILSATGTIVTVAGQCGHPYTSSIEIGDDGPATGPVLFKPKGVVLDSGGNLYIADVPIRKVSNGIITTVAVAGASRLAIDAAGNLYSSDGSKIYLIANTVVTTLAGSCPACAQVGNGAPGTSENVLYPGGLTVDSAGNVYFADVFGVQMLTQRTGTPVSTISPGGVLNAASFVPGIVAPGSTATVFGGFALNTPMPAATVPLPTSLSGLSIQFQVGAGINAPLFYASSTQANIQVPWELDGHSSVQVRAVLNGNAGPSQTIQVASFAPGIFVIGAAQGAIVDSSGKLVDSGNPTTAGSTIQIYCTGLGEVTNPPATGTPSSTTTLSTTTVNPTVTIGGVAGATVFSGLAPGTVGEYQVNVVVPPGVSAGSAVPVVLTIGGVTSNTVTIGVR